jgi:hypothetical protein
MFQVNSVSASKAASEYGHLASGYDPTERSYETTLCSDINSYFSANWVKTNGYWDYTTEPDVVNSIRAIQNPINGYTWATTFWVGDFVPTYTYPAHWGFNGNAGWHVMDENVYSAITSYGDSKQYFDFMWTCVNGGKQWIYNTQTGSYTNYTIPGISGAGTGSPYPPSPSNPNNSTGYFDWGTLSGIGMPFAWTDTSYTTGNQMSLDGYAASDNGQYCYIGFENQSPFMKDVPPSGSTSTNLCYVWFPYYFYRYALGIADGIHHNVHQSLDYAALNTFGNRGSTFEDCQLNQGYWFYEGSMGGWWFCKMRVFGNSAITLPS